MPGVIEKLLGLLLNWLQGLDFNHRPQGYYPARLDPLTRHFGPFGPFTPAGNPNTMEDMILASLVILLVLPTAAQVRVPTRFAGAAGLPVLTPSAIGPSAGSLAATLQPAVAPAPTGPASLSVAPLPMTVPISKMMALAPDATKARLAEAVRLLRETPSGSELLRLAEADGTRIVIREGYDWLVYFDNTDNVQLGPAFIATYDVKELAIVIAHELEHARQNHLGMSGYFAQEREWGALSVEARVWVELGGSFDVERWRTGHAWAREHVLWTAYPAAAFYTWQVRSKATTIEQAMTDEALRPQADKVKAYWEQLQREEAEWRQRWAGRIPVFSEEILVETFRGLMRDSVRVMRPDRFPGVSREELLSRLPSDIRFDGR